MYNIGIIDEKIGEKINEIYSKQVSRIDDYRKIFDKIYGLLVNLNKTIYNISKFEELFFDPKRHYYIVYHTRDDKIEISLLEYDIDYAISGIKTRKFYSPRKFKIKLLNELLPYIEYKPVSHIIDLIRDYCRYVSTDMVSCNSMRINIVDSSTLKEKGITISLDYGDPLTDIIVKTTYGEKEKLAINSYVSIIGGTYISVECSNKPSIECSTTIYHDTFSKTIGEGMRGEELYETEYKYSNRLINSINKALDRLPHIVVDDEIINLYSDKYRLIELVTYILVMEYV